MDYFVSSYLCPFFYIKTVLVDGEESDEGEEENNLNLNNLNLRHDPEIIIDVDAHNSSAVAGCITNIHQNYPILCNVYKDPENQFENVVLAVSLPGGAYEPRVELSADGMIALIKYGWPNSMFNIEDIFKKELDSNRINEFHPKILSFKNALEHVRDRVDARPEGLIKVNLPIKVQTAVDTWSKGGLKREDGTYVAFAQFKGFIKEYNKKSNEYKLIFNL